MKDLSELVDQYIEQNKLYSFEGQRGVRNLTKLVEAIGYNSRFNNSSIEAFLEDNSGAIEAMVEWIRERNSPEWQESLSEQVAEETEGEDIDV